MTVYSKDEEKRMPKIYGRSNNKKNKELKV